MIPDGRLSPVPRTQPRVTSIPDEARSFPIPDFVPGVWTPGGSAGGRRRVAPAALLPPSRSSSLRHGHAHGRADGPIHIGQAHLYRPPDLPLVPRLRGCAHRHDSCPRRLTGESAGSLRAAPHARRKQEPSPPGPHSHPRRPRPSRTRLRLKIPLKPLPSRCEDKGLSPLRG